MYRPTPARAAARPRRRGHRGGMVAAGLAVAATLALVIGAALAAPSPAHASAGANANAPAASGTTALAQLATLPVKGKAPRTGYARTADFGTAWLDVDHNGCDTRDDILRRDLTGVASAGACKITSGTLVSPYAGTTIHFVRGVKTSTLVQIDHVVPLEDAWQTGAQQLSQTQREALANDPSNLFAVDRHSNEQKGDGDAATWLPAAKSFRCTYIAHQVAVKAKYGLWVTSAEHDAMGRILGSCPGASATPTPSGSAPASAGTTSGAASGSASHAARGVVPVVVGASARDAKRAVAAASLHYAYKAPHHQHVHVASNWLVTSQRPAASAHMAAGSTVTVHLKHKTASRIRAEHRAARAAAAARASAKAAAAARAARVQAVVDARVKAYDDAKAAAAKKAKVDAIVAARQQAYRQQQAAQAAAARAAADAQAAQAAQQQAAAPAAPSAPSGGTITPGAVCSASSVGQVAQAANGRSYECGGHGPDARGHDHWNTM